MPDITNHQRNANENHNALSSHTSQNGYHQYINKQQVIASMWRKGNPHTLLVGMQIGAATVESSTEFLKNLKIEVPYDSVIPLMGIHLRNLKH